MKNPRIFHLLLAAMAAAPFALHAQPAFVSGSDGSDGDLIVTSPPSARTGLGTGFAYDSTRQRSVFFGGWDGSNYFNGTWEWNGAGWTAINVPTAPSARDAHSMAYDPVRQVVVMFGGLNSGNVMGDTWEYNGATWTLKTPAASPSARCAASMVYDPAGQRILLIGGRPGNTDNTPSLMDTWSWNGTAWTQVATATALTATAFSTVGSIGNEVFLFGGYTNGFCSTASSKTWRWTGTNWQLLNPSTSPGARGETAWAFSQTLNSLVLFGGASGGGCDCNNETWSFNGTTWSQLSPATVPAIRHDHVMVRDASGDIVMFGGNEDSISYNPYNSTWLFNGTNWRRPSASGPNVVIDMSTKTDGIWRYGRIEIQEDCTVTFKRNALNTPVVWLAQEDVYIAGHVNLSASAPSAGVEPGAQARGGPGGYDGGLGGRASNTSGTFAAWPGIGPGGGSPGTTSDQDGGAAGHAAVGSTSTGVAAPGQAYGNRLVLPVVGGSGGGGEGSSTTSDEGNGGAGGGAILIASSGTIRLDGITSSTDYQIAANGSSGSSAGGGGSGGSIHLIANRIEGDGFLRALGGTNYYTGSVGRIRLDAWTIDLEGSGGWDESDPNWSAGPPLPLSLSSLGTVRVVSVDGVGVTYPTGSNTFSPHVTFNEAAAVAVAVQTTNVPNGSAVNVRITGIGTVLTAGGTVTNNAATVNFASVPSGLGTVQAWVEYTAP